MGNDVNTSIGQAWQGVKDAHETVWDVNTLQWGKALKTGEKAVGDFAHATGIIGDKAPDPQTGGFALSNISPEQAGAEASIEKTKAAEGQMRSASTTLTGGAGLLDEPRTASRVLLGN